MSSVFLAAHPDDETLWGAFTIMRERPLVVIVLGIPDLQEQRAQGPMTQQRIEEAVDAAEELGVGVLYQWQYRESDPDWPAIRSSVFQLAQDINYCYAPLNEPGGHEQHNELSLLAQEAFGPRISFYATYTASGRSRLGNEVVPEPWMIPRKLRALACYESQMLHDATGTREWFMGDLREYLA